MKQTFSDMPLNVPWLKITDTNSKIGSMILMVDTFL